MRSTQQQFNDENPVKDIDPETEFMQLTHELGEISRSWTTFFPPKVADLTGGASLSGRAGVNLSAESRRPDFISNKMGCSFAVEINAKTHTLHASAGTCGETNASDGTLRDRCDAENNDVPDARDAANDGGIGVAGGMGNQGVNATPAGEEEGRLAVYNDEPSNGYYPARGNQRGNFTLPTESWAYRSAESRGHYFTLTGDEGGRAERSLNERWPRKRSTGTTMRTGDCRNRSDLRSASENRRPWTSPAGRARGHESDVARAGRRVQGGEAVRRRLSKGSKG